MTEELCSVGSATDTPCTNVATEAHFGTPMCEEHGRIINLGEESDDFALAAALLGKDIAQAREVGAAAAVALLERARDEAEREYRRVVQEMDRLEPG